MRYLAAAALFALAGASAFYGEMFLSMVLLSSSIGTVLWRHLREDH